ncbi:MAG: hypothetical protein Q4D79_12195, partial [Propionibacteriaceae bacterium]|nr:hypothetical protein [Propionibacteriaceae bacterium]
GYGQPGYGQPPEQPKKRTGLIIGIVAVLVVLLGGGIYAIITLNQNGGDASPSASPSQSKSSSPKPTESPTKKESSKEPTKTPATESTSNVPAMPESFGSFTAMGTPDESMTTYTGPTPGQAFSAIHFPNWNPEMIELTRKSMQNAETFGSWTCGTVEGIETVSCMAEAHGGLITVSMGTTSGADTAKVGDEFLAAWK